MTEAATVDQPGGRAETVTCPHCGRRNRVRAAARGVPRCAACATALPWLTTADDRDFELVVWDSTLPVLVDMWAPWCGPCRIVAPGVERAARELAGRLKAVKVDVDEAPETAARFQIQSIPALLLIDRRQEQSRQVGAVPPDPLLHWVRSHLTEQVR
jgi:thioredoxin 2